jgi:3-hydroxyacyl-[acyl-carrier-protein] dehydratase
MTHELEDRHSKLVVFTGIERAKFRRPVTPGDQLRIEVDVLSFRSRAGKIHGRATVDGKLACEATLTCAVVARERDRKAEADAAPAGGAAAAEGLTEAAPVSATVAE